MTIVSTKRVRQVQVNRVTLNCQIVVEWNDKDEIKLDDCTFFKPAVSWRPDEPDFECPLEHAIIHEKYRQDARDKKRQLEQDAERAALEAMDQPEPVEV